jgi:hypothetical protein
VLNARERTDRFGPKQSVRIGDEAYRFRQRFGSAGRISRPQSGARSRRSMACPDHCLRTPKLRCHAPNQRPPASVPGRRSMRKHRPPGASAMQDGRRESGNCGIAGTGGWIFNAAERFGLRCSREMLVQHSNLGQHGAHRGTARCRYQQTGTAGERKWRDLGPAAM